MNAQATVDYKIIGLVVVVVVVVIGAAAFLMNPSSPTSTSTSTYTSTSTSTPSPTSSTTAAPAYATLQLDWLPGGNHLAYYVAKDRFWPEMGLNVDIIRGAGSGDTVQKAGTNTVDFGLAGFDAGVLARTTTSLPCVTIMAVMHRVDSGYLWLKDRDAGRGVISVDDLTTLQGKILGDPDYSITTLQLPAFLDLIGLPHDAITCMNLDPAVTLTSMLRGDIDFIGMVMGDAQGYSDQAALEGYETEQVFTADLGLVMVADTIWTSQKMINERSEVVTKFVQGLQEAFVWTLANRDEAATIMAQYVTGWTGRESDLLSQFNFSYMNTIGSLEDFTEHGIGYMPPDLMGSSVANAYVIHNIDAEWQMPSPTEIYTNQFLDSSISPTTYPW